MLTYCLNFLAKLMILLVITLVILYLASLGDLSLDVVTKFAAYVE